MALIDFDTIELDQETRVKIQATTREYSSENKPQYFVDALASGN